ncbi:MAG: CBS domain-containing protein, partial [Aeromonas sp.]
VRDGVKLMLEKGVSCLPVLENGALVGIISWKDFLKVALESDALD